MPLPSSSPTLRLKPNTIFHIEQHKGNLFSQKKDKGNLNKTLVRPSKLKGVTVSHWDGPLRDGLPDKVRWDWLEMGCWLHFKKWMAALRFLFL